MIKKILLVLGVIVILFAGVNTAAAINSSILDAISGLPLSDQILFIAKEVDRLKLKDELRDACDLADGLFRVPTDFQHFRVASMSVPWNLQHVKDNYQMIVELFGEQEAQFVLSFYQERTDSYLSAKADCDRLTEEFNQKYGD